MSVAYCTIITQSHLPYAKALASSIRTFRDDPFFILVSDTEDVSGLRSEMEGIHFLSVDELLGDRISDELAEKHSRRSSDIFRWSFKPILIRHLLKAKGYHKVIFLDADLFFFSDFNFLINDLDRHRILLSPHWRDLSPETDPQSFNLNFTHGMFNGGFVAVHQEGIPIMDWWASACNYACRKDKRKGIWVDQKYLDLIPCRFTGVGIIRHKGCNVAQWNLGDCPRQVVDGEVLIDGEYPIIFIHFSGATVKAILKDIDPTLKGHLAEYEQAIQCFAPDHTFELPEFSSTPTKALRYRANRLLDKWFPNYVD